jgi:hypothetical protein
VVTLLSMMPEQIKEGIFPDQVTVPRVISGGGWHEPSDTRWYNTLLMVKQSVHIVASPVETVRQFSAAIVSVYRMEPQKRGV